MAENLLPIPKVPVRIPLVLPGSVDWEILNDSGAVDLAVACGRKDGGLVVIATSVEITEDGIGRSAVRAETYCYVSVHGTVTEMSVAGRMYGMEGMEGLENGAISLAITDSCTQMSRQLRNAGVVHIDWILATPGAIA